MMEEGGSGKGKLSEGGGLVKFFYKRLMIFSRGRFALWILGLVSFLNSSIFPVPQDAFLLPMMLANPKRSFFYATFVLICSCAGGVVGYGIGYFLYDTVGEAIVDFYGYAERVEEFKIFYEEYGWVMIVVAGITPFPYKIITIMSGFLGYGFVPFLLSSLAGRSLRFYAYVLLFMFFGEKMVVWIERWFGYVVLGFVLTLLLVLWITIGGL
jgi:membrane protein YqaA with SNARE-associated domain